MANRRRNCGLPHTDFRLSFVVDSPHLFGLHILLSGRRLNERGTVELAALILSGIATVAAGAALFLTATSSPTKLAREFAELSAQVSNLGRGVISLRDDNATVREDFQKHRVGVQALVDESLEALSRAETKRRRAAKERSRAEEVAEGDQDQGQLCVCGRVHPPQISCVQAAEYDWATKGVM